MSLFLVSLNQHGRVLVEGVAVAATSGASRVAVGLEASRVVVLVPRQRSTEAAFEERPRSMAHILLAEVSADQAPHLDSMVGVACLPCSRMDSLAQLVGPPDRLLVESRRGIVNQIALEQLPLRHVVNQIV